MNDKNEKVYDLTKVKDRVSKQVVHDNYDPRVLGTTDTVVAISDHSI